MTDDHRGPPARCEAASQPDRRRSRHPQVALVGATGAGKTTIARLVARFYDPVQGTVTLDGVDLRRLAEHDLRRAVVIVTQENFLCSAFGSRPGMGATVADNIRLGRPDATRSEVEAAARAIGADEFIAALPDGFDTEVRKRGGRLSADQRQLVSFARAFIADPAVLILPGPGARRGTHRGGRPT